MAAFTLAVQSVGIVAISIEAGQRIIGVTAIAMFHSHKFSSFTDYCGSKLPFLRATALCFYIFGGGWVEFRASGPYPVVSGLGRLLFDFFGGAGASYGHREAAHLPCDRIAFPQWRGLPCSILAAHGPRVLLGV